MKPNFIIYFVIDVNAYIHAYCICIVIMKLEPIGLFQFGVWTFRHENKLKRLQS